MQEFSVDLDKLATHLRSKMEAEGLSVRAGAKAIGFGASTLSRLLQGNSNENVPDLANISKAAKWLGKSLADFSMASKPKPATIADVEVQLRGLPGLANTDVEMLVAMVKATYKHAKKLRSEKG
jgi:transcriptional regulator with XRE-family HTH domain